MDESITGLSFAIDDSSVYEIQFSVHGKGMGWSPWVQGGTEVSNPDVGINALRVAIKEKKKV